MGRSNTLAIYLDVQWPRHRLSETLPDATELAQSVLADAEIDGDSNIGFVDAEWVD